MANPNENMNKNNFINWSIEASIKIGLVALIIFTSYVIFKPFILPVAWGIIISISLFPLAKRMNGFFGGRKKITAIVLTVVILAVVIVPTVLFTGSLIEGVRNFKESFQQGNLHFELPDDYSNLSKAKQFVITKWHSVSKDLSETLRDHAPQLKMVGEFILSLITGLGGALVMFIFAIIIAGVLLTSAEGGYNVAVKLFTRLTGDNAEDMVQLSIATIRSVSQGVIGVAVIQAALVGIGFFAAGVPGASILTLIVMIMAIVQLPPIILVLPVIIYVYSIASTTVAIVFAIWSIVAGMSDNFLKPLLLGRGMDIPMLVILVGALGGMVAGGMIGLFIGPVVLALGYQLFKAWVSEGEEVATESATPSDD